MAHFDWRAGALPDPLVSSCPQRGCFAVLPEVQNG